MTPKPQITKEKQTGFHQNQKSCASGDNHQESEKTTHKIAENICKSCI